jgi:hypothetical protein
MLRVVWVAASVVAALALVTAASARPAGTGGAIVFSANPEGKLVAQLFSVSASGGGLRQLTSGAYPAIDPAFSPNGKRIAFARVGVGIFTIDRDGGGLRRLTKGPRDAYPAWSPDGKQLAFVRPVATAWKVEIVSLGNRKLKQLSKAPPAGRPSWTKAGLLIPSGGDLLRIDTATGRVLKYYDANIDAIWGLNSVSLPPSSSVLTYVGSREPDSGDKECGEGPCQRFGLYLERLTGKNRKPRVLVKDTGPAAFSPDGKNLVYVVSGALFRKPIGSGAATMIPTGAVTLTVSAPPTWR